MPEDKNQAVNLLGWSFVGNLGMEMAYILEQMGYMKVKVYLLDALASMLQIKISIKNLDFEKEQIKRKKAYVAKSLPEAEVEKRLKLADLMKPIHEELFNKQLISKYVMLFKVIM